MLRFALCTIEDEEFDAEDGHTYFVLTRHETQNGKKYSYNSVLKISLCALPIFNFLVNVGASSFLLPKSFINVCVKLSLFIYFLLRTGQNLQ